MDRGLHGRCVVKHAEANVDEGSRFLSIEEAGATDFAEADPSRFVLFVDLDELLASLDDHLLVFDSAPGRTVGTAELLALGAMAVARDEESVINGEDHASAEAGGL